MPVMLDAKDAAETIELLEENYPDSHYYLNFKTPIDLLVAAILSAQTKDEIVNRSTPALFDRYRTAKDYANADLKELEDCVKSVSFAGNKARNIIKACNIIVKDYCGKVPDSMDALLKLPGIGRKTANTILINAYGIVDGIPVDTWVIKISNRTGLSISAKPDLIEEDLKRIVKRKYWRNFAYVMKAHGHAICKSVVPVCSKCFLNGRCRRNGVTRSD